MIKMIAEIQMKPNIYQTFRIQECGCGSRTYLTAEEMQDLPVWIDLLSRDDLMQWIESREAAGATIDTKTCEVDCRRGNSLDPYSALEALGELPEGYWDSAWLAYARSPQSGGWVHTDDLPAKKARAVWARLEQQRKKTGFRSAPLRPLIAKQSLDQYRLLARQRRKKTG